MKTLALPLSPRVALDASGVVTLVAPRKPMVGSFARLLRPRRKRPRHRRAAEQRDELAPFPLTEMHPIPHGPEAHRKDIGLQRISQRVWKASRKPQDALPPYNFSGPMAYLASSSSPKSYRFAL